MTLIFIRGAEAADTPPIPPSTETINYFKKTERFGLNLSLSMGIRRDSLKWNTAATNNAPNIISELEWSDVISRQLTLSGSIVVDDFFYSRGQVNYAWVHDGTVRDSDYGGDDHNQEWSRSMSESNGDQLWDVLAGVGYPFMFNRKRLLVAPMLGASMHKQNLRITNGRQTFSGTPPIGYEPPPAVGPLNSQLNSLYSAQWFSLWTGFDLLYAIDTAPPIEVGLSLAYHFWSDYSATADWNLRGDLQHPVSFEHDTDARGLSLQARWLLHVTRHWRLHFNLDYCRWTSDPGVATFYRTPPLSNQTTRLNEVNWESLGGSLGATYRFF